MGASPITRAPRFSNLRDVDLSGLADGDAMLWNASTGKWEPGEAGGVQYAASGAGTQGVFQAPNGSQELADSTIYSIAAGIGFGGSGSNNIKIENVSGSPYYNAVTGGSHVFRYGSSAATHLLSASSLILSQYYANFKLEVRSNSGNPQQRWAYDASNYGERYATSAGVVIDTATGNEFQYYKSGTELIRTLLGSGITSVDYKNTNRVRLKFNDSDRLVFWPTYVECPVDFTLTTKTPASASATGTVGTIAWDASYIYVCTATNTWKRVAIATW